MEAMEAMEAATEAADPVDTQWTLSGHSVGTQWAPSGHSVDVSEAGARGRGGDAGTAGRPRRKKWYKDGPMAHASAFWIAGRRSGPNTSPCAYANRLSVYCDLYLLVYNLRDGARGHCSPVR